MNMCICSSVCCSNFANIVSFCICSMQIHLADNNIPGKDRLQESEALTPGNDLMTFDTGVCSVQS